MHDLSSSIIASLWGALIYTCREHHPIPTQNSFWKSCNLNFSSKIHISLAVLLPFGCKQRVASYNHRSETDSQSGMGGSFAFAILEARNLGPPATADSQGGFPVCILCRTQPQAQMSDGNVLHMFVWHSSGLRYWIVPLAVMVAQRLSLVEKDNPKSERTARGASPCRKMIRIFSGLISAWTIDFEWTRQTPNIRSSKNFNICPLHNSLDWRNALRFPPKKTPET